MLGEVLCHHREVPIYSMVLASGAKSAAAALVVLALIAASSGLASVAFVQLTDGRLGANPPMRGASSVIALFGAFALPVTLSFLLVRPSESAILSVLRGAVLGACGGILFPALLILPLEGLHLARDLVTMAILICPLSAGAGLFAGGFGRLRYPIEPEM